ncbi:MAG TPA: FecR domain-containing protein [Rhizomicrobium sp.]|jgi:transmembrane sensor|nr:FecR domain-containing protein [Rhizomicrobium sp.]
MNGGEQIMVSSRAMEIEAQAATWLRRKAFWDWTANEQAELDAWLREASAHRVAFWRLNAAITRTERLSALRGAEGDEQTKKKNRFLPFVIRASAVLAIVCVASFASLSYYRNSLTESYQTPIGGREVINLGDGSRVELNTDTVLRTNVHAGVRSAELVRGEAYFQIRHDTAHPFVVEADGHRVIDLGTEFLVRDDLGHLEVTLVEGRARIDAKAGDSAVLKPGDVATVTAGKLSVTQKQQAVLANQLGWRSGVLIFKYTTLADAASEFNRYNSKKLVIADQASARRTIVGTFPVDDVTAFTDVVQDVMRLHVSNRGDEIVISR